MQVEQKRSCGSCGSENTQEDVAATRGASRGVPPVPISWGPPASEAPRSAASSRLVGAIVSLVAAAAGYLGVQFVMGPDLSLPDTLAGAERLTDAESQRFERYMANEGDRYDVDTEAGVYGAPLAPEFFVILVDASAAESTDQLFDGLVMGFSQAGAVVDGTQAWSGMRRDSDYRCVSAAAGAETAVACLWRDDDNVGIVLEMGGDLRRTKRLLWTVHDTVVG